MSEQQSTLARLQAWLAADVGVRIAHFSVSNGLGHEVLLADYATPLPRATVASVAHHDLETAINEALDRAEKTK